MNYQGFINFVFYFDIISEKRWLQHCDADMTIYSTYVHKSQVW